MAFRGAPAYKAGLFLFLQEDHSHRKIKGIASLDSEFEFSTHRCDSASGYAHTPQPSSKAGLYCDNAVDPTSPQYRTYSRVFGLQQQ